MQEGGEKWLQHCRLHLQSPGILTVVPMGRQNLGLGQAPDLKGLAHLFQSLTTALSQWDPLVHLNPAAAEPQLRVSAK